MPLWIIFHPPGTLDDSASKEALAQDITKIYTEVGLPAFYVVVNFVSLPVGDVWVGAKLRPDKPFIRITIDHIAVNLPNEDEIRKQTTIEIEAALKKHIADKGYDWEYHVDETDRRLWRVNGMIPPPLGSEAEKLWVKENRPVNYDGAY